MNGLKLVVVAMLAAASSYARGEAVGPLPYQSPADSPFDPTGSASGFFFDDFSTPPTVVYRPLPPYGLNYPFATISTPGVEIEGMITWDGSQLGTFGSCTDSIPPSCHAGIGFQFDVNQLGRLPSAVGFAIGGLGTFTLSVYDAHDELMETTSVNLDQYYNPPTPPSDGIIGLPPPPFVFVGAIETEGILRILMSANSWMFAVDDFQYGSFVPEPPTQALAIFFLGFIAIWRFRPRHWSQSKEPAALARPCADVG